MPLKVMFFFILHNTFSLVFHNYLHLNYDDKLIHFLTTDYGPALIEHSLLTAGFPENSKIDKEFKITEGKIQSVFSLVMKIFPTTKKIEHCFCHNCNRQYLSPLIIQRVM